MTLQTPHIPELLAPAGSPVMLHAAIDAGADAVYLGMGEFNARRNADNFDLQSLAEACDYAHLRGARIYIAMNTIILPKELESAVSLAKQCHHAGADAFIIQDLGLLAAIKRALPAARIHASTQMNIHNEAGIYALAELGVERITLARELSLGEIAHLCQVATENNIEIETFAHGALCICYSGQCLMSSMIGGRSANRGLCAQACRLPYELKDVRDPDRTINNPGAHLLSPKDLCTIDRIDELAEAGVSSLKIEGRMKSPEYVHEVVSVYREALDSGAFAPAADARDRLEAVFSRGFTEAYLAGKRDNSIMSYQRPNNRGASIGRVRDMRKNILTIATDTPLVPGDILEVWTSRTNVTVTVPDDFDQHGGVAVIPLPQDEYEQNMYSQGAGLTSNTKNKRATNRPHSEYSHIHKGDRAFRIRSAATAVSDDDREPRIPVACKVEMHIGSPLEIAFTLADDGSPVARRLSELALAQATNAPSQTCNHCQSGQANDVASLLTATAAGVEVEAARTRAISVDDVVEHVARMGQTSFRLVSIDVDMDEGVGIGFSQLHRIRAEALDVLADKILKLYAARSRGGSQPDAPAAGAHADAYADVAELATNTDTVKASTCKSGTHADAHAATIQSAASTSRASAQSAASTSASLAETKPLIYVLAANPDSARAAKRAGADAVCVPAANYKRGQAVSAGTLTPDPKQAGYPKNATLVMPAIDHDPYGDAREATLDIDVWAQVSEGDNVIVDALGSLYKALAKDAHPEIGPSLPVTNASTVALMEAFGADLIWLSPELNLAQITALTASAPHVRFGVKVYGAQELMVTEHCLLMSSGECAQDCPQCTRRRVPYVLHDRKGFDFPVITDALGRSHLYNSVNLDNTNSIDELLKAGVSAFMVDTTLMDVEQAAQATGRLVQAVDDARSNRPARNKDQHATTGHLFRGVL